MVMAGNDKNLITFAGDRPFGLVNVVQQWPEGNTTVDNEGEVGSSLSPMISWTSCMEGVYAFD
jgi:hypothetical protein